MIQIGSMKYIKKEEGTVVGSLIFGLAFGLLPGAYLSYSAGFFKKVTFGETDISGVQIALLRISFVVTLACWLAGIISCILLSRRNGFRSAGEIRKMITGTLLIPLTLALAFLVFIFITVPVDAFLFSRFGISSSVTIDMLIFSPFVILFVAAVVPDCKPGKAIRRFVRHRRKHEKIHSSSKSNLS
jgi:hypothetical protein